MAMLRKTVIALLAFASVGLAAPTMALARGGGGGGGGGHGGGGGGFGGGGGGGGGGNGGGGGGFAGAAHGFGGGGGGFAGGGWHGGGPGLTMRGSVSAVTRGGPMTTAPINGGHVQGWSGRTAWGHDHFHDHFHHRFHNRNFFAFGFGGYGYDSC